eukprot:Clim_evm4s16 gene=Clim_evmTU4s16
MRCTFGLVAFAGSAMGQSLIGKQFVVGHRGAATYYPENTVHSFDGAMMLEADYMECDVVLTADGIPVCLHDDTIDRTSDCTGVINDLKLEDARQCDYGSWFNDLYPDLAQDRFVDTPLPTLAEHLDCAFSVNPKMRLLIEIKEYGDHVVDALMEVLEEHGLLLSSIGDPLTDKIVLQSFSYRSLERARALHPNVATGFLLWQPPFADFSRDVVDMVVPRCSAIYEGYIESMHDESVPVFCYTINNPDDMRHYLTLGVDGIITDSPDIARQIVDDEFKTGTSPKDRGTHTGPIERICPDLTADPTAPFTEFDENGEVVPR